MKLYQGISVPAVPSHASKGCPHKTNQRVNNKFNYTRERERVEPKKEEKNKKKNASQANSQKEVKGWIRTRAETRINHR
jgi:hypothetical protein